MTKTISIKIVPLMLGSFVVAQGIIFCAIADDEKSGQQTKTGQPPAEQLKLLESHGVGTDTDSIIAYLHKLQPGEEIQDEIDSLIKQLASSSFDQREKAQAKLKVFGVRAKPKLILAAGSGGIEAAWRSGKILDWLDSGNEAQVRSSILLASLQVLKSRSDPNAVSVLLQLLNAVEDTYLLELATESIWASIDASHTSLLQQTLAEGSLDMQAAAIVGLEIAAGEAAVPAIEPFLKSKNPLLKLAAARALIDRQPKASTIALLDLLDTRNVGIVLQADALLQLISGKQMELSGEQTLPEAWQAWRDQGFTNTSLKVPLGAKRLKINSGFHQVHEFFSADLDSIGSSYGPFLYESGDGGKAKVVDGKLVIEGSSIETDQRLYILSRRILGRERWPDYVEVRTKLGGTTGNNFGWHVGVSVGRVKTLFHPGLSGGGFRAETDDTHSEIFSNENMGFVPATDIIHEMIIKVTKTNQGADFEVAFQDGNGAAKYDRKFTVDSAQLGEFNRIGLERSGRTGGSAIFDSVTVIFKP